MDELIDSLLEVIREACQDLNTMSIPLRPYIRAVPATSGTSVWSFQDAQFRADWHEVARQAQIIRWKSTAADCVRVACISAGLSSVPTNADEEALPWIWSIILMPLLDRYFTSAGRIQYDEQLARVVCAQAVAELLDVQETTMTYLTPLLYIHLEMDDQIEIEPGVHLRRVTAAEIESWYNPGGSQDRALPTLQLFSMQCAIEVTANEQRAGGKNLSEWAGDRTTEVVTALRLLTDHNLYDAFSEVSSRQALNRNLGRLSRAYWRPMMAEAIVLKENEIDQLRSLYKHLRENHDQRIILAVRRWGSAIERPHFEDRLIDYWIALEALFSPSDNQEIKYRAALRIATLLGDTPDERVQLYDAVRHSYDWRSTLVHGGSNQRIKSLQKKKELDAVVLEARAWLRTILLQLFELCNSFDPDALEQRLLRGEFGQQANES